MKETLIVIIKLSLRLLEEWKRIKTSSYYYSCELLLYTTHEHPIFTVLLYIILYLL